jgi:phosphoenolpyruvate carboxykinase (GTP)
MLVRGRGYDIISSLGAVGCREDSQQLFRHHMDPINLAKLDSIEDLGLILRIANAISLCEPDTVFIHSGTEADMAFVRTLAIERGEEFRLAAAKHSGHFDLPEDQGRLVESTFYVVNESEPIGAHAKKMERAVAHDIVRERMKGIMRGKTMLVGIYSRGPIGAEASVPALQISDSAYVMHSADLLYRNAYEWADQEIRRAGLLFANIHSMGSFRSEDSTNALILMDRSWATTYSMHCTYAGNTLMLKKGDHRFAVDIATYFRPGEILSEHMFITGITGPGGRKTFFAGAAPSGCGKTTTAMVGSDLIGDDLAQLWIDSEGVLRAINPETGIFGIVQDVNETSDPCLIQSMHDEDNEVIWSNVLVDDSGTPRWVGDGLPVPESGRNWLGRWTEGSVGGDGKSIPLSHPNARATLRSNSIATYNSSLANDPAGVAVSVITYSGRDSDTMPPVWVAGTPDAGVAIGASILSAATATEVGVTGVQRQPWANAAFIAGPIGDYMNAQFAFFNSPRLAQPVTMAGMNFFLTRGSRGGEGQELIGEKRDVIVWLAWIELFAHGEVESIDTPIGHLPLHGDLRRLFETTIGKEYSHQTYTMQFSLYVDRIVARLDLQEQAYRLEPDVPRRIFSVYDKQRDALRDLESLFGTIVSPDQLVSILQ